ncbi:MAG TPA: hypothetical protein VF713_13475, partial [Thermoanaerobaculia bacterium]
MKCLVVCLSALFAIPGFGKLGPSVEVPVAPPTLGRAAGAQGFPHVATDGHDFFAVWIDSRGGNGSVYGTRVLADGTVLDPTGILVSDSGAAFGSPGLVWDGANYVVVWQEEDDTSRVSFVRVDRNGAVLGTPKTLLDGYTGSPSIASNGHGSMVIFSKPVGTVVIISQDGSFTRKNPLPQDVGRVMQSASNGDGYLLSWTDTKTSMIRLDDNGDVVPGSAQQLTERGDYTQLIAGIGGPYLLVGTKWGTGGSACAQSIVGRLVTGSGVSDPFVIHDAGGADIENFAAAPDGNGFQVVWMKRLGANPCGPAIDSDPPTFSGPYPPFGLSQIHVGQDGSSGTPSTVAEGSGFDQQPSVARNSAAELLVWVETPYSGNSSKIAAAIAHPDQPLVPIAIASSAAMQIYSGIAASENTFMTVWSEQNPLDLTTAVYARRFGTDGRALDAAPVKVSDDQANSYPEPVVSFDGAVWLFLWSSPPNTLARRMTVDGNWIDAAPLTIGVPVGGVYSYAAASSGNGFAVLTIAYDPALTMTFIPRTGDPRKVPVAKIPGLASYIRFPSMAWDGTAYVAVWFEGNDNDIEGIRLDQDGQIITPLTGILRSPRLDTMPSVACHEGTCAVAWQSSDSIAAASLVSGTLVPFFTVTIAPSAPNTYATFPKLVATPDGFRLFWNELGSSAPSLLTASLTAYGLDSPNLLGAASVTGAAITTRGQMGLSLTHAAND